MDRVKWLFFIGFTVKYFNHSLFLTNKLQLKHFRMQSRKGSGKHHFATSFLSLGRPDCTK